MMSLSGVLKHHTVLFISLFSMPRISDSSDCSAALLSNFRCFAFKAIKSNTEKNKYSKHLSSIRTSSGTSASQNQREKSRSNINSTIIIIISSSSRRSSSSPVLKSFIVLVDDITAQLGSPQRDIAASAASAAATSQLSETLDLSAVYFVFTPTKQVHTLLDQVAYRLPHLFFFDSTEYDSYTHQHQHQHQHHQHHHHLDGSTPSALQEQVSVCLARAIRSQLSPKWIGRAR